MSRIKIYDSLLPFNFLLSQVDKRYLFDFTKRTQISRWLLHSLGQDINRQHPGQKTKFVGVRLIEEMSDFFRQHGNIKNRARGLVRGCACAQHLSHNLADTGRAQRGCLNDNKSTKPCLSLQVGICGHAWLTLDYAKKLRIYFNFLSNLIFLKV